MLALVIVAVVGVVLACLAAAFALRESSSDAPRFQVALEIAKAGVSLAVISAAGALAKYVVDRELDERRQRRSKESEAEAERQALRTQFADVFSEFYSIRKFYHSFTGRGAHLFSPSPQGQSAIKRDLLGKVVALEGRYGAVKVRYIHFMRLPSQSMGTQRIPVLKEKLKQEGEPKAKMRLQLDLLGEYYDEWRHGIEAGRDRLPEGETIFPLYETLLAPLEPRAG